MAVGARARVCPTVIGVAADLLLVRAGGTSAGPVEACASVAARARLGALAVVLVRIADFADDGGGRPQAGHVGTDLRLATRDRVVATQAAASDLSLDAPTEDVQQSSALRVGGLLFAGASVPVRVGSAAAPCREVSLEPGTERAFTRRSIGGGDGVANP